MADIRTKDGREAARQRLRAYAFMGDHIDALDGLDIAEEMAEHMENHPMTASGKCTRCKVLTRQWRNWKGG